MNDLDYVKLDLGERGIILHNENLLTRVVPIDMIPMGLFNDAKNLPTQFFKIHGNGSTSDYWTFPRLCGRDC